MPVTFTSYKVISGRKATAHDFFIPSSPHTRPNHLGGCQPRASSSDMVVPYSPTPMEGSEFALAGVSGIGFNSGLSSSCEAPEDAMNEHEKEVWKELFDMVDVAESGISNFTIQGDLDHSNGLEW
ncbi:hypothetical protein N7449_012246 [Penicillium cf. viridicatum]|uniref:Uncharacterized protein n=1 Tax=Penicillium cf. viridicatum TaxID=2972119 RepID=A0A9W9IN71_9EURO|nr:hypothetical protein N7449_012246 [Penicillium cf. viridicatum]